MTTQFSVELEQLRQKNAEIIEAISLKRRTNAAPDPRIAQLTTLVDEKRRQLDEANKYVKDARAYIADFPTDQQTLKLERRVESLKDQIKQAERIASQHKAGIDGYMQRLNSNHDHVSSMLDAALSTIDEVASMLDPLVREEQTILPGTFALQACDALSTIACEREKELQQQCALLDRVRDEQAELTTACATLLAEIEDERPLLESEKETDVREILEEWHKEEALLRSILEKLYVIHKEQSYHLQRGTHIKRETVKSVPEESEIVLSARQSHLAAEVNKGRSALQDLKEELQHAKKQVDLLRQKEQEIRRQFEQDRSAKEQKLAFARKKHTDAAEEAQTLRNLRAELYQALQEIRDGPTASGTPRKALPKQITNH